MATTHVVVPIKRQMNDPLVEFVSLLMAGNATEVAALLVLALYVCVFLWYGIRRRRQQRQWLLASVHDALASQFALVEEVSAGADGFNQLAVYSSGRAHCRSCHVTLDLPYTFDLLYFCRALLTWEEYATTLTVRVEFMNEDAVLPLVYALVRREHVARFLEENEDVRIFGRDEVVVADAEAYVVRTENKECSPVPANILRQLLLPVAADDGSGVQVHSLLISDQINLKQLAVAERAVCLRLSCGKTSASSSSSSQVRSLVLATLELVDHLHQFGPSVFPSPQARLHASEARSRIQQLKQSKKLQ